MHSGAAIALRDVPAAASHGTAFWACQGSRCFGQHSQTREQVHSHIHCALDTYRCFLCTRLGPYAHLPPLMRTSKSTLDLEVNHAVACVRIA